MTLSCDVIKVYDITVAVAVYLQWFFATVYYTGDDYLVL